jgi:hypothetical protein
MTCLNAARDGLRIVGENTIIRDSHIKDCGRIQTELQDTKGLGIHALSNGISNTSNLLIEGNLIEGCRAGGIGVQQQGDTRNVIVRNNILRNFGANSTWPQHEGAVPQAGTGINFGHGSYFYAYNNLIYNVGRGGDCFLAWGGGLDRPEGSFFYFYNNTCHDTYIGIVMLNGANNVTAMNNIFSSVDHVDILGSGANNSNSNYVTNPDFVNAAAGDFRLNAGSPGIDEGVNLSSILTADLQGLSRDSNYDVGAFEFNGGLSNVVPPSAPSNVMVSQF